MKFSKLAKAFYPEDMLGDYEAAGSLPNDLEDFSIEAFQDLMNAKTAGKIFDWSGSVPVAVDAPPAVPEIPSSVSPAQARLALHGAGLLTRVEAIVAAADVPTQIAWNNASIIERTSPTVAALAGALGLTDAQLDDLFTAAAGIFV
jgi:hypothetical protein